MGNMVQDLIDAKLAKGDKNFRGMKLPGGSFVGQDLRRADFRASSLPGAKFNGSDLTYASFESANCSCIDTTDAILHRTNFKDADLAGCIWAPADCFGVTLTLECKTFQGMKILPGWWYGWIFYALLMKPPSQELEDKLIAFMGTERYTVLRQQYARRQM